jgi:Ca2+-transporting ATPase
MKELLFHTLSIQRVLEETKTDVQTGLSKEKAAQQMDAFGPNSIIVKQHRSLIRKTIEKLKEEPMVALLLATGVLYILWGEVMDAITIIAVILLLWIVEESNEERAEGAIKSLSKLSEPCAAVRRAGEILEIPMEEVVPGDIVFLQAGRRVPADARLLEAYSLAVDESSFTGESTVTEKDANAVLPRDTALSERGNLVFSGTLIARGRGTALVYATGLHTEIGRLASLAATAKPPRTSLQLAMDELSKTLVWFALGFSVLVPLLGVLVAHQPFQEMLLIGLTLAFATIPEEMPIIITMVLALGSNRLAKQNAIVRRFQAVESLGAVTVIATDKTGTLTENRMNVVWLDKQENLESVLDVAVLCSSAIPDSRDSIGDPMEVGLLRFAVYQGADLDDLKTKNPLMAEYSFDNQRKRMSVVVKRKGQPLALVKGAPETVLQLASFQLVAGKVMPLSEAERGLILQQAAEQAENGLRVLALAQRPLPEGTVSQAQAESELIYLSLVGFSDPVRPEAQASIQQMHNAGIRTIMITGDHPLTARHVAGQIGLDGGQPILTGIELDRMSAEDLEEAVRRVSVFARTTPEHKLRIVLALQSIGERVVVTGDGTNDAPALAAADIGVAMGETGTDVAREAAGIVLADDNYTTIVNAVREGRLLFENLRKGVRYYLACKLALILVNLLPVLLGAPVPFSPVQIILMELFMDLAASATFVAEPAEMDLLNRNPRDPNAKFIDRSMLAGIIGGGLGLFAAVISAYLITWVGSRDLMLSQTVAFYSWLLGHVLLAVNLRSERLPLIRLGLFSNQPMLVWMAAVAIFLTAVAVLTPLQTAIKTVPLSVTQIGMILGLTFLGTFWQEGVKLLTFRGSNIPRF